MRVYVSRGAATGQGVLVVALNIWLTKVIVFALVQPDPSRDVLAHFDNKQRNNHWWDPPAAALAL